MKELSPLSTQALLHISQELQIALKSLVATITLFDEGATVPFIARYRKEVTGNLDEVQIQAIQEKLGYQRELEERRQTVLRTIEEQGKLSPELRARIEAVLDKSELEDLYLPFKPKRRTKAMIAREKGLEPLADYIWNQTSGALSLEQLAGALVNAERSVENIEQALEGARHIVAERISEIPELRQTLRRLMFDEGLVTSRAVEGASDPEGKFQMYANYSEPAGKIPSHRMLAIRRGAQEDILYFEIELESARALFFIRNHVIRASGDWVEQLELTCEDAWNRLLNPSIQTEVRLELKERADSEAIRVFRENLRNVLLAAPAGSLSVLAIDPGIRTGCKVAVVDGTGKFLESAVIYPLEPRNDVAGSVRVISSLIQKHAVRAIAIGNGTGSRETDAFVRDFLSQAQLENVFPVVVNESGASVYSASEMARQEFPDLDLTIRGAISIARRLQDPLAELVKIDPKSIGVGQYQHDVDQRKLQSGLEQTVESCVNRVGVDLNTASFALLKYVSGINERTAIKIVEFRNEHGAFRSRMQLTAVPGLGPKTFEQAAGFLRIRDGDHPLDMTAVHPESYPIVERIAASAGVTVSELIASPELVDRIAVGDFTQMAGIYTLKDIQQELRKPGRDPRDKFIAPKFRADVREIADLQPGMVLEGTVTNVTNFGAFIDVGVHQDGLVHVSELSNRFVKDPNDLLKAGQIVQVQVLTVDPKARRIALSMKALQAGESKPKHAPRPRKDARPSIDNQLQSLSTRFRTR